MCGIAGYMSSRILQGTPSDLISMTRALRHRGPDDEGFVLINVADRRHQDFSGAESDAPIRERLPSIEHGAAEFAHDLAMGHRRFSIIDLSCDGHQPMWDAEGGVCVSFYGEIYNYVELRSEIEAAGGVFRTRSDTEVILEAYRLWGTAALERFNGPFTLALYDRRLGKLLLARDRIGKASLYYTLRNGRLYWATEIKAFLRVFGAGAFSINERAVDDFAAEGMRDHDGTFWNEIHDFPPASFCWVEPDKHRALRFESYWTLPQTRLSRRQFASNDAIDEFRSLLVEAIRIRQRADVPVAFELSGGMDSSAIVGLTATQLQPRLTTFTVKNRQAHADEEPYARAVIDRFPDRIDSRVLIPQENDFWDAADEFVWIEEEPFHSPNLQTNQRLRRAMRADGFKAVIAGSAGDELLAGYSGDYLVPFLRRLLRRGAYLEFLRELTGNSEIGVRPLVRSLMIDACVPQSARARLKRHRIRPYRGAAVNGVSHLPDPIRAAHRLSFEEVMVENMGRRKMNYWLRAGPKVMFGIPIEPRSPFLDYRLVEFAFSLPPELLIKDGWFKWILRQSVKDILPAEVVWRKTKMGFPFPLREWLSSSRGTIAANLEGIDCPYIRADRLMASFDQLTARSPDALWRLVSIALWWRRVIEGRTILRHS